jgi:hypothetical protein
LRDREHRQVGDREIESTDRWGIEREREREHRQVGFWEIECTDWWEIDRD